MLWFRWDNKEYQPATRWNPLYTLFYKTCQWGNGEISAYVGAFSVREQTVKSYSYAVPDEGAIDLLARYGPFVEIGAGSGYWAKLLRDVHVDIVAYDIASHEQPWTEVLYGNELMALLHADRTLFLCWPPLEDNMALRAVKIHALGGGNRLAYIGEHEGGCTANDEFFAYLDQYYEVERSYAIPQWPGVRDRLWVYKRVR